MALPGTVDTFTEPDGTIITVTWSPVADVNGNAIGNVRTVTPPAGSPDDIARQLIGRAQAALSNNATYLAVGTPTQAQAVAQVAALTRQVDGIIRLLLGAFDTTAGT